MYAAGKIPGGFIKKEGRPSDQSILNARLIDRPIRPLWPKGFNKETHIVATVLSVDKNNPYDVLALVGRVGGPEPLRGPVPGPGRRRARGQGRRLLGGQPHLSRRSTRARSTWWWPAPPTPSAWWRPAAKRSTRPTSSPGSKWPTRPSRSRCEVISAWAAEVGVPKMEFAPRGCPTGCSWTRSRPASAATIQRRRATCSTSTSAPTAVAAVKQEVLAAWPPAEDVRRPGRRDGRVWRRPSTRWRRRPSAASSPSTRSGPTAAASTRSASYRLRRGGGSAHARLGSLHPRPDPGAHPAHPGRRPRRAARRRPRHRRVQALHASLQVPALQRGRDRLHARPRPARDRSRRPGRAGAACRSSRTRRRSPTPSAWSPRPWSPTAPAPWPACAPPPWP